LVDQRFQIKPRVLDGSKGNEFPAGTGSVYYTDINFPPVIVPSYLVFAIKYQDKEVSFSKTFSQIWYFKQPGGTDKAPPLHFLEPSILEREAIINQLKQELEDYLKYQ
jgi:hypothetical protein